VSLITTFGKTLGGVGSCDFLACQDKKEKHPFKNMDEETFRNYVGAIASALQDEVDELNEKEKKEGKLPEGERIRRDLLKATIQQLNLAANTASDNLSTAKTIAELALAKLTAIVAAAKVAAAAVRFVYSSPGRPINVGRVLQAIRMIKALAAAKKGWKDVEEQAQRAEQATRDYQNNPQDKEKEKKMQEEVNKLKKIIEKKLRK
jgi:hypothetical protein